MIDWIQHWDEMRFYHWSGLSWIMILPVYIGGLFLLGLLWWLLAKVWKKAWILIIAMLPVLAIAPWWEELNIAWSFGQLCKQDAGIFVYKTVEVEGFYDTTRPTHDGPRNAQAAEDLDRGGYRFYEMVLRNMKGGSDKVVHLEKAAGVWTATVLDHPTARYHYMWPHMNTSQSHKTEKIERIVSDSETNELLARETKYSRKAPWFYVGLDRPVMLCPSPGEHPLERYGSVYNLALKPVSH